MRNHPIARRMSDRIETLEDRSTRVRVIDRTWKTSFTRTREDVHLEKPVTKAEEKEREREAGRFDSIVYRYLDYCDARGAI